MTCNLRNHIGLRHPVSRGSLYLHRHASSAIDMDRKGHSPHGDCMTPHGDCFYSISRFHTETAFTVSPDSSYMHRNVYVFIYNIYICTYIYIYIYNVPCCMHAQQSTQSTWRLHDCLLQYLQIPCTYIKMYVYLYIIYMYVHAYIYTYTTFRVVCAHRKGFSQHWDCIIVTYSISRFLLHERHGHKY